MNSQSKFLTLLTATVAFSSLTVGTVLAQAKLTNQSKVTLNGIGTVRVGMTVKEAAKAAGTKLVGDAPNNNCYYVKPQSEPQNIGFMVTKGRISRVDVRNSNITTLKGAKIGDTQARIKSLYPGQIKVTAHKYVQGGHYLTLTPKDPSGSPVPHRDGDRQDGGWSHRADGNYRVVFETDGKRVTTFRSGKLPEVEYVEGCS